MKRKGAQAVNAALAYSKEKSVLTGNIYRAFTLIELLVVVAVIVIMMSLAIPAFNALRGGAHFTSEVYNVAGTYEQARPYAVANKTYVLAGIAEVSSALDSSSPSRVIKWPIRIDKPGAFSVQATYSLESSSYSRQVEIMESGEGATFAPLAVTSDSSEITACVDGQTLAATLKTGKGLDDFKTEKAGEITIKNPGEFEVISKSTKEFGALVINLRGFHWFQSREIDRRNMGDFRGV